MKSKGKKEVALSKEEAADSWCFVCKDGGDIRICDNQQCLKCYHPRCVEKDDSFLESDDYWACDWHTCYSCRKSSYFRCYTCTTAFCRRCLPSADFLQIKPKNGFCSCCLKLALLIEENKDIDSNGVKVDFTDRNTCEGLYMEYYNIIKDEEGFTLEDLRAALNAVKKKKGRLSGYETEESDEEEVSDYDAEEYEKKSKRNRKGKRSVGQKSTTPTPTKSNKQEFVGWASKSLLSFLSSIGESRDGELSQREVTDIIYEYVKENKLVHPERRKMVICDEQLQSLFKKKTLSRYRIYDLLDDHFAENCEDSEEDEDDELADDTEDSDADIQGACKRQKKEKKLEKKEVEKGVLQSCFASVVAENVKLVYLKRSLLHELLKKPESFEEKVIGCFVRVKCDPHDCRARNSHQLMQVKGVKTVSIGENQKETLLLFSAMPKEIRMSLISDDNFSEEECKDLREKVVAGEIERPKVADLQQKAKILHEDLTKHWITKELALLRNLIDRANEKGWRRELFEYLEKQKRLQTPSEQSRLLANVPTVIPDINELDSNSGDMENDMENNDMENVEMENDDMKSDKSSPKSIPQCDSSVPGDRWQDNKASEDKAQHDNNASRSDKKQHMSQRFPSDEEPLHNHDKITRSKTLQFPTVELKTKKFESVLMHSGKVHNDAPKIEVIELLSDDESAISHNDDVADETWCVLGPDGDRDKCTFSILKKWSSTKYASEFKVWREGQNEEDAIWLREAVGISFPKK
ncbi:hypothetical protein ABFS82_02G077900 [Erythranthe guttata]|nr:PREDICTED: uncharacterized protein At5g08430 [Erythranthe guttata]|eukprot:XP_012840239.1 PREDICTED: uncharacterized protein At5g08430 [Erythranthe guttata]